MQPSVGVVAVAKKRKPPERTYTGQIRLDAKMLGQARLLARLRGIPVSEMLSDLLIPILEREMVAEMKKTLDDKPKG